MADYFIGLGIIQQLTIRNGIIIYYYIMYMYRNSSGAVAELGDGVE